MINNSEKNINHKKLRKCSVNPITGYYRNGYCTTGINDLGTHTVCATMDKDFLKYTSRKGNNLNSVVKPGDNWCLCEKRWEESYMDGKDPKVIQSATNLKTDPKIIRKIKHKKSKKLSKGGGKKKKETQKQFLYNPNDPKKSFDVYIDKNPKDTISIRYKTLNDVKKTIRKLERLYKQGEYPHKRIWQVGMILKVRLHVLRNKKPQEYKLAEKYFKHLGNRTKIKNETNRKKYTFHF